MEGMLYYSKSFLGEWKSFRCILNENLLVLYSETKNDLNKRKTVVQPISNVCLEDNLEKTKALPFLSIKLNTCEELHHFLVSTKFKLQLSSHNSHWFKIPYKKTYDWNWITYIKKVLKKTNCIIIENFTSEDQTKFLSNSCRKMSFFTNLSCTFKDVKNTIQCRSNRYPHISKNVFIQACYQLSYIFERIGNAVLVPIKLDLQTGLKDLKSNYTSNNDSLLEQVHAEMNNGENKNSDSVTQTLLWIIRILKSVSLFCHYMTYKDSPTYMQCFKSLSLAYHECLVMHNNWLETRMALAGMRLVSSSDKIIISLVEQKYLTSLSFLQKKEIL